MVKLTRGYFHCIECGLLFEDEILSPEKRFCPNCGRRPTGGKPSAMANLKADVSAVGTGNKTTSERRFARTKRKEKTNKAIFWVLLGWFMLTTLTVGVVKFFSKDEEIISNGNNLAEQEKLALEKKEAERFVREAIPICGKVISDFMESPSAASKAQYVYRGRKLITEMSGYYAQNPTFSSTRSLVKIARANLLKNTRYQTVSAVCINKEKEVFEVNFINYKNEWLIDWQSLVRYDSQSWSLFPTGSDGDVGEFRLYMRVRDSNKDLNTDQINLVFYKPQIYLKGRYDPIPSSTVIVMANSEIGKKILSMVGKKGEKNGLIQSDPTGYHRVRVKLKLHKKELEHHFELLEILASHWYGDEVLQEKEESE